MNMACIVLASGLSRRFGEDDKLLAELKGQALLAYCLDTAQQTGFSAYFVVTPKSDPRADLARKAGFEIIDNENPESGMGHSLALGAQQVIKDGYDSACILLGDMPFITAKYLKRLKASFPGQDAVFSESDHRNQPPAIFKGQALIRLSQLKGDQGASALDFSDLNLGLIKLPPEMSQDFDRVEDFDC